MYKKVIYLTSFVLVLGLALTGIVEAADANLVGWWKFDEVSGPNAQDSSGNGNDGTLIGNPQWVPGKVGGALDFDGDGDYVDCGASVAFDIPHNITVGLPLFYVPVVMRVYHTYSPCLEEGGA